MRHTGSGLLQRRVFAVIAMVMAMAVWARVSARSQDPPPPPSAAEQTATPPIPASPPQSPEQAPAQGGGQPPPAAMDGFVPMGEGAPREVLPATPLVFYAYGFVWVALIGYVFLMWRRMARVEQELADVQRRLREGLKGR